MGEWEIKASKFSELAVNPLRRLWELHQPKPNPAKSGIFLQIGDPTIFGNLPQHPKCVEALTEALKHETFSYDVSAGIEEARKAVVDYSQHMGKLSAKDVILTSGCSMALEIAFISLANPGENILIPRPAWNYVTWMFGAGIEARSYNLDPLNDWNVDLKHLESMINAKTRAILLNSPGNPCGNVFSKEHILEILKVAERHKLPIISDEVYEHFVFPGVKYHSVASLSTNVPVLTCSGLTKRFLLPGIRMGWLIINDRGDKFKELRKGLETIAGRNFGPSSTVQQALPSILKNVPQAFFDDTCRTVGSQAKKVFDLLKTVPGLDPIMPKGAMYMMVGINLKNFPKTPSCLEFMIALANEESVFVFPGENFNFSGYFRIVMTAPEKMLIEACNRLREFCEKHFVA